MTVAPPRATSAMASFVSTPSEETDTEGIESSGSSTSPGPAKRSSPVVPRLLAGVDPRGISPDLAEHIRRYGSLPLPERKRRRPWADNLIRDVDQAGLSGRGGAGFPTAIKLAGSRSSSKRPFVIVNAMDSEPASSKDRVLATGAPHLVLDGAAVLATAVNAHAVMVCVSQASPESAHSLFVAASERAGARLDPVAVQVLQAPEGYVSGEESSLVRWLNEGVARPVYRPGAPGKLAVRGRPVVVNNAETCAHLALIARRGSEWFRQASNEIGLDLPPDWGSTGTILMSLSGAAISAGVYEVPAGLPLNMLLEFAHADPETPGVLLGGYGGTWLPPAALSTPLAAAPLRQLADRFGISASLGAGVILVLPSGTCPLAETARIARWMAGQSAGQCGPCVFGLPALAEDLERLSFGRAPGADMSQLLDRLAVIHGRGACHHPDGVVRMVRTSLTAFWPHVQGHLAHGPCDGVHRPSVVRVPIRQSGPEPVRPPAQPASTLIWERR